MKIIAVPQRWTLQQQLKILIVLFLCLGGASVWLLAELFQSRESAIAARTQGELARANARLMQHYWEGNPNRVWSKPVGSEGKRYCG